VLLDQIDSFNAVRALGHHIHAAHRVQQVLQLVASQLFVIDNERGNIHRRYAAESLIVESVAHLVNVRTPPE
jgi:hypothetical protein